MSTRDLVSRPQYSPEAEQVVLGSVLSADNLIADVIQRISPDDFYEPRHATILQTMLDLSDNGRPVELASLITSLRDSASLDQVGGPAYVAEISRKASPANAIYYANVVAEKSAVRKMRNMHLKGLAATEDGSGRALDSIINEAQESLDALGHTGSGSEVVRLGSNLANTLDKIEELGKSGGGVTGVPTGFVDLDRDLTGLHPGQMIVVAARPGVGKTTLGLDIVRNAAINHQIPSLFFSLEMSKEEIDMKILSAECRIDLRRIRSGKVEPHEWERIGSKYPSIEAAPLFVDDTATNTMTQIRAKAKRIQQRHGLGLIVIDYMQLMRGEGRAESRQNEVSEMSRQIKLMAKELKVPVIAMSQLNRQSESRGGEGGGRPRTSDLRESGAIEQDADAILLIHREEVNNPDTPRVGECDVIIGKNRLGPQGVTVILGSQLQYCRFVDHARDVPAA